MAGNYLSIDGLNTLWAKIKSVFAPKVSPTFTGNPTAPTPPLGDSSKSLATTEFVANAITGASAPTDYIIAEGESGGWHWTKYANGRASVQGVTTIITETTSQVSGVSVLPFPIYNINIVCCSSRADGWAKRKAAFCSIAADNKTLTTWVYPDDSARRNHDVHFQIYGNWK